jgi:hypothetical protein
MSKSWGGLGGAGAWALDAERAEEEDRETAAAPAASFPTLATAGAGKSKKKMGTILLLSEVLPRTAPAVPRRGWQSPRGSPPRT